MKYFWIILSVAIFWILLLVVQPAKSQTTTPVDIALVLLVDVSSSIDQREYALQKEGIVKALKDEKVKQAVLNGILGKIAITIVEFDDKQVIAVPWFIIESKQDMDRFANLYELYDKGYTLGNTFLAESMIFASELFPLCGCEPIRKIIDVSGDGPNNGVKIDSYQARDIIVGNHNITINGLVIIAEEPLVEEHYRDYVIGGPGHFLIILDDFHKYFEAMKKKLILEIS